jgi:TrmH family RNA methyltransferase
VRKLHQAKERHRQALFLLEGTHLLQEACAVRYPLQMLCCTPDWQARHPQLWARACEQTAQVRLVTPAVLQGMATTVHPDGVLATVVRPQPVDVPDTRLTLGLGLERIQDPGNLGALIRTAAAAGSDGFWLSGDSVDVDHPKVLRASAGQWFRLPMTVVPDLAMALSQLGTAVQIVATDPRAELDYWALDLRLPTLFLLGNEGAGLSPEMLALATQTVKIPLAAGVESLNVAIAGALLLYEAQRQRRCRDQTGVGKDSAG